MGMNISIAFIDRTFLLRALYTVNLLNAKWKVVPARNSGWKKKEYLYESQFASRCLNLKL